MRKLIAIFILIVLVTLTYLTLSNGSEGMCAEYQCGTATVTMNGCGMGILQLGIFEGFTPIEVWTAPIINGKAVFTNIPLGVTMEATIIGSQRWVTLHTYSNGTNYSCSGWN